MLQEMLREIFATVILLDINVWLIILPQKARLFLNVYNNLTVFYNLAIRRRNGRKYKLNNRYVY